MAREQRLVFGEVADDYDRIRPDYPAAILDALLAVAPGRRVVEVGAGTGRATVELLRRGCAVTALEPSAEMAAVLAARVTSLRGDPAATSADPSTGADLSSDRGRGSEAAGSVEVVAATFEAHAAQAAPSSADVVAAFQAWHWVDPTTGYAGAARLLGPGGALALCWNHPEPISPSLRRAIDEVYARTVPGFAVREPGAKGRDVDAPGGPLRTMAAQWFDPPEVVARTWQARYDAAGYVALLATQSDHRLLPDRARAHLLEGVAEVIEAAGGIEVPYLCRLVLSRRHG